MAFNFKEISEGSPIEGVQEFPLVNKALQDFMDNMISNMQYLGDDDDPNILLLLSFFFLHHTSHFELECLCC